MALGISERLERMKYYDGVANAAPQQSTEDSINERNSRINMYNNVANATPTQSSTIPYSNPTTFQDVNTNFDVSSLDKVNTDFGSIKSSLYDKMNTTTDTSMTADQLNKVSGVTDAKNDIKNFDGTITQDMLSQQRGLRSQSQLDMEKRLNQGLDSLQDYSSGNSKVDRTIANATLGRFDASSAAANLSQAQRIASNPYLSEGAKNVASAELARTTASQRAQLSGQLAQQSQERAFTAADKYANLALQASQYEEGKFKDDMANINQSLDRNLSQLKMVGDLSVEEAGMAMDQWRTEVSTKLADAARSLDAAVAIGELDQAQANIEMSKAKTLIDAQVQKAQLDLEKLRGIQDNKMIDAQIQQLENENIGIWSEREANAIIDWKTAEKRDDGDYSIIDDVNAIKDSPAAMAAITQSYQALMKNPNAIPTDEYILAKLKAIPTPQEASLQSITNKLVQLKTTLVGDGPGQISLEQWPEVENYFKTLALTEGAMKINKDGTVSVVGADGAEMMNIGGYTLDSLKSNYGDFAYEIVMNNVYNDVSESEFVQNMTDPNSRIMSAFSNKEPLSKSEATSLYRAIKTELDSRKTNTTPTDTEWKDTWEKVQEDPRFDDLGENATATLFQKSGATNFDEFSKYVKENESYGDNASYTLNDKLDIRSFYDSSFGNVNEVIKDKDGKYINTSEYTTVFKNADDPNSPNHELYKSLLNVPNITSSLSIGKNGNHILNAPKAGGLIAIEGRLMMVKSTSRSGGTNTGKDTITLVDLSSGAEKTFSGKTTHKDSLKNLGSWAGGL